MEIGHILLGIFGLVFIGTICGIIYIELSNDLSEIPKKVKIIERLTICAFVCMVVIVATIVCTMGAKAIAENNSNGDNNVVFTVALAEAEQKIHIKETEESLEVPSEAPSAPTTEETVFEVDQDELEMLACVVYQEAGGNGSCDDCRRYVADIVLNRVEDDRFPDTMKEVLTAKRQYGRFYWTGVKWPSRAKNKGEQEAVARAYRIAEEVLSGQHSKLYGEGYIWQAGFKQGTDGFWCCGHYYGR